VSIDRERVISSIEKDSAPDALSFRCIGCGTGLGGVVRTPVGLVAVVYVRTPIPFEVAAIDDAKRNAGRAQIRPEAGTDRAGWRTDKFYDFEREPHDLPTGGSCSCTHRLPASLDWPSIHTKIASGDPTKGL